jgi:hypothetical protein
MSPFVLRINPENLSEQLERATVMFITEQVVAHSEQLVTLPSLLQDYAYDFGGEHELLHTFIPYHIDIDSPSSRSTENYRTRLAKWVGALSLFLFLSFFFTHTHTHTHSLSLFLSEGRSSMFSSAKLCLFLLSGVDVLRLLDLVVCSFLSLFVPHKILR